MNVSSHPLARHRSSVCGWIEHCGSFSHSSFLTAGYQPRCSFLWMDVATLLQKWDEQQARIRTRTYTTSGSLGGFAQIIKSLRLIGPLWVTRTIPMSLLVDFPCRWIQVLENTVTLPFKGGWESWYYHISHFPRVASIYPKYFGARDKILDVVGSCQRNISFLCFMRFLFI